MHACFLFGITAKFINDCISLHKYFWEGGYNIMRKICGCIKALDFIPVLCWAWKRKQAKYCSPFPPWALRQLLVLSQCVWCVTALTSSKTRPWGAPKRACVHTCECTFFLNTELTSSICVLGVCGAQGHSLIDSGACECWTFRQLCVPLCTSATLSQLRNNTPCSLHSPTALQCEAHTQDPLHLLVPIYNAEDGGCFNLQFINEASWHSSSPYVLSIVPCSHCSMQSIYVSLN